MLTRPTIQECHTCWMNVGKGRVLIVCELSVESLKLQIICSNKEIPHEDSLGAKDPVLTDCFEDAVSCQWLFPRGRDDKIIITSLGQSHMINNLFITKLHFVRISWNSRISIYTWTCLIFNRGTYCTTFGLPEIQDGGQCVAKPWILY